MLAREARGLTQSDLSERLNSYKASVSGPEQVDGPVNENTLIALANATHYPPHFFIQKGEILPVNLSYRKRKQVPTKLLTPIEAQMNIIRNHAQLIINGLSKTEIALPLFEVTDKRTPVQIASLARMLHHCPQPGC